MNDVLYRWLQIEFFEANLSKYRKYFEEWVENITPEQIDGFQQQMIGKITKSKQK